MSHSSTRPTRFVIADAALLLAALACAGHPSDRPVEPATTPVARENASDPASSPAADEPPAPSEPERAEGNADEVVTRIAKPGLWPLDVEAARMVLQASGMVAHEQRSDSDLSLVGGPYGALDRFDIAYSLDDKQYWVFGSAGFFLEDRDPVRLYHALEARLTQLLGKPARSKHHEDGALPPVVWDLGEAWLSLAPTTEHGQDLVSITIRENETYSEPPQEAEHTHAKRD